MIKGWHKLSLIDYPGHLCATVFLGGCNFRCFYCHNKGIAFSPESFEDISTRSIVAHLEKRRGYIEGVCISGGEPTIHDGLPDLITEIKSLGYKVKLDTNGSRPEVIKLMIRHKLVDYIAMDVKAPKHKYQCLAGLNKEDLDMDAIQESIDTVKKCRKQYEFRTTIVPGFLELEDINEISYWLTGSEKYVLQTCRGDYGYLSEDNLKRYAEVVAPHFQKVEVR